MNSYTSGAISANCTVTAAFEPVVNGTCGTANAVASLVAPSANLCSPGTASTVTTNVNDFTWSCTGAGGGTTASCAAPHQYTVTATAGANGALNCASPVNGGSTSACTATPASGYRTLTISGCGGTATTAGVDAYTTAAVVADCAVNATFELKPLGNTTYGGAPFTGTTVPAVGTAAGPGSASFTTSDGGLNCRFDAANTGFIASTASYPSYGATLPHGMFRFKLIGCAPGFTARITLTLPSMNGLTLQKYGRTSAGSTSSFFQPMALGIAGNTATFNVTDGIIGDDDFAVNGEIADPVAAVSVPDVPVPTLDLTMLMLLALLLAGLGWRYQSMMRRR